MMFENRILKMNSWTELAELLSQLPVIDRVNDIKKQLDAIRPLPTEVEGRVMQKLRLEWNYHSNAIEGNKLTYGETYSFLMYGLTAKGKPFKDHLDIKGHNDAIRFLTSLVKDDSDLTEVDIRGLHKMILVESYQSPAQTPDGQATSKMIRVGEYKQQPNHVLTPTGEIHYFATPEETPIKIYELVQWYNTARQNKKIHPSVLAAFVHHRFVNIHPFDDGNGRLARILMNLILMKNGYPPAIVRLKERSDYYQALNQADRNEYVPLVEFLAEAVSDSMNLYLKATKGESIEDDADLDKEIALFKGSFEKTYKIKDKQAIIDTFQDVFLPIIKIAELKFRQFDDLFARKIIKYHCANMIIHYSVGDYTDKIIYDGDEMDLGYFSLNNLDKIAEKNFDKLGVSYNWFDFNKFINYFAFSTNITISYKRLEYQIEFDGEVFLSKSYDDNVTDFEKNEIANKWVRLTFEDLKKKIEEANKS